MPATESSTSRSSNLPPSGATLQPLSPEQQLRAKSGRNPLGVASGGEDDDEYDEAEDGEPDEDDDDGAELSTGIEMHNETTIKSGYLMKRGEKRKNWKKRWFVLRTSKLYYYKNEKEYQLLRFIDMDDVHTVASIALKRAENCFGIVTSKRQYYVRASSKAEMDSWIDALNDVREQVRQRSTLTQEIAAVDLSQAQRSGSEGASSPPLSGLDRPAGGGPFGGAGGAGPSISIAIPGKGVYSTPAQPRPIPGASGSGATGAFSPLTATSGSEEAAAADGLLARNAAEQFGLSYASSAGLSASSSPSRGGGAGATLLAARHADRPTGGHSPQSHGVELGEDRSRAMGRSPSVQQRGVREASSGSQGRAVPAQPLSSSEDEDEWDEDEGADQAMPLPGTAATSFGLHSGAHMASAAQQQHQQQQQFQAQQQTAQSQTHAQANAAGGAPASSLSRNQTISASTAEFLKDPNKIIVQGYLMKQSNRRKHWRKRWFVLSSSQLTYARSHMDTKHQRQIPLTSILDAIEFTPKRAGGGASGASVPPYASPPPPSPSLVSPPSILGGGASGEDGSGFSTGAPMGAGSSQRRDGSGSGRDGSSSGFHSVGHGSQGPGGGGDAADTSGSSGAGGGTAGTSGTGASTEAPTGASVTLKEPTISIREPTISIKEPLAPSSSGGAMSPALSKGSGGGGVGGGGGSGGLERKSSLAAAASGVASNVGLGVAGTVGGAGSQKKEENCFKIITPKRAYVVCAPTEEEEIKWLSALQTLLSRTRVLQSGAALLTPGGSSTTTMASAGAGGSYLGASATSSDGSVSPAALPGLTSPVSKPVGAAAASSPAPAGKSGGSVHAGGTTSGRSTPASELGPANATGLMGPGPTSVGPIGGVPSRARVASNTSQTSDR